MTFTYVRVLGIVLSLAAWGGTSATAWGSTTNSPLARDIALFEIPKTIRELNTEADDIHTQIEGLPELAPPLQYEAYGYHGGYLKSLEDIPEEPQWTLDITFSNKVTLNQVILVPAIDYRYPTQDKSYGFPRRMRISNLIRRNEIQVIKEWMDDDIPDPGRIPLTIDMPRPKRGTKAIRIEVFRGQQEGPMELFALDEVFTTGANNRRIPASDVNVSSEYESLPHWSKSYVIDQKTNLGLPLAPPDENIKRQDYYHIFDEPPEYCSVELDMGSNKLCDGIVLYPASTPESNTLPIPGYGFPGKVSLEIIQQDENGHRMPPDTILKGKLTFGNAHNVFPIACDRYARWFRFQFSDFPIHNGEHTFALGEINIHWKRKQIIPDKIRVENLPTESNDQLKLLCDTRANGQPVMLFVTWLKQIQRRGELSKELNQLTALNEMLQARWTRFWTRSGIVTVSLLLIGAITAAVGNTIARRRSLIKLKWRIAQDLHDEVGSNLGGISLLAEQVGLAASGETAQNDISEISLMAREAAASLRDVVWVVDKNTIRLPELAQKLGERLERVLGGTELSIEIQPDCPDLPVSLTFKRHLIMLFKEMVNNCGRHAHATHVSMKISTDAQHLQIVLSDDGCGFDTTKASNGWGLKSMKERAQELGGKMELDSQPGKGTTVALKIPLSSLAAEPKSTYKTSN